MNPSNPQKKQDSPALPPEDRKREAALTLLEKVADETTRNTIIAAEVERSIFEQDHRLARVFQISGQFKDLKSCTEEQGIATAMAKIRLGRGWNLNETESMQFVVFINGVPTIQNEIIASRLMDAGYFWDLIWEEKPDPSGGGVITTGCTFLPKFRKSPSSEYEPMLDGAGKPVKLHFGHYEASRTNIYEGGKTIKLSDKWNYVAYPRSMYFWRNIAMFRRQYATNILSGARMPLEAEEVSLDSVLQETDRRREAAARGGGPGVGGSIQDKIANATRENAERLVRKLLNSGQLEQAKQSAAAHGIDWEEISKASVDGPGPETITEAGSGGPQTQGGQQTNAEATQAGEETAEQRRVRLHAEDLRVYLGKIGDEFGKILASHGIGSLKEASESSDGVFLDLIRDFEKVGKPKVEDINKGRKPRQDDFNLRGSE